MPGATAWFLPHAALGGRGSQEVHDEAILQNPDGCLHHPETSGSSLLESPPTSAALGTVQPIVSIRGCHRDEATGGSDFAHQSAFLASSF